MGNYVDNNLNTVAGTHFIIIGNKINSFASDESPVPQSQYFLLIFVYDKNLQDRRSKTRGESSKNTQYIRDLIWNRKQIWLEIL